MNAQVRRFDTGASRDLDVNKLDPEGFLSPLVLRRYCEYMHSHRQLADGTFRDSDNWMKGIPKAAYMKSGFRHFFDWWCEHRGVETKEGIELALCGLLFNTMGFLHEHLKSKHEMHDVAAQIDLDQPESATSVAVDELLPPGTPPLEIGD